MKKLVDVEMLNDIDKTWKEQKDKYDKVASLKDIRKLDGRMELL